MATQANSTLHNNAQALGVTAVAQMVRGAPAIVYRVTIPETTGSNVVELRRAALEGLIAAAIEALDAADGDPDIEEDDPQGEATEDEPAFDARSRLIANMYGSTGPGCIIGDVDCGGEEAGEVDEGAYGHTCQYGIDQTRPIGPDNLIVR